MSKAAHTPLPWKSDGEDFIFANGLDQDPIFQVRGWGWLNNHHGADEAVKIQQANLDLVITAVNNHQELLTRLCNLANQAEIYFTTAESYFENGETIVERESLKFSLTEARELIKKLTP